MTILITGARGTIARCLADQLRRSGADVRLASRSAAASTALIDFAQPETIGPHLEGVDKIFCYAADHLENLITAAERAGVRQVVLVSSLSVELPDPETNPIASHHLHAERLLQESRLDWTSLRPGTFATNDLGWADSIKESGVARIAYPDAYLTPIHEADIADVAFAALTEDGHRGKAYPLTGPESLTQRDQAAIIGAAIGRTITVEALDRSTAERFLPPVLLDWYEAAQAGPGPVGPCSSDITGRPSRTFKQWADDHAADFR